MPLVDCRTQLTSVITLYDQDQEVGTLFGQGPLLVIWRGQASELWCAMDQGRHGEHATEPGTQDTLPDWICQADRTWLAVYRWVEQTCRQPDHDAANIEKAVAYATRASPRDRKDVSAHSAFGEPAARSIMWWLD
jgi:hypothetical protein